MKTHTPTFVTAGGGATGALFASQVLVLAGGPVNIVVVDPAEKLGGGAAYGPGTPPRALLNVPTQKMFGLVGATKDDDFQKYLAGQNLPSQDGTFAPRVNYGDYLSLLPDRAKAVRHSDVTFRHIQARAIKGDAKGRIWFSNEETLEADAVVVALGNQTPVAVEQLGIAQFFGSAQYIHDPWRGGQKYLEVSGQKLIVGMGLTSVDLVLEHLGNNASDPIHVYSRSGKFPQAHDRELAAGRGPKYQPGDEFKKFLDSFGGPTLPSHHALAVKNIIIREMYRASRIGSDWRQVIDRLRPETQKLWQSFDEGQKNIFLTQLRRAWDTLRHRIPPENWETIQTAIQEGRLVVHQGDFPSGIDFSHIINGTGLNPDYSNSPDPFIQSLIAQHLVQPGPLGLGLSTNGLLNGAQNVFFPAGPLCIGDLWEIIAIPDIRKQVRDLAIILLKKWNIPIREDAVLN